MEALLVVNKAKNKTSRDVVNELNHIFSTKRVGHTGTLDPLATGVLVCLIGKYTKLVNLVTSYDKEYIATIKLGIKTDTGDITGKVLEEKKFNVDEEKIKEVFKNFPKTYMQEVPIYSAVKINGKKLYEYARAGQQVVLPKRKVHIYSLELLDFHDDIIKFKTRVSKGTYIRALIEDVCNKLDTVGTMDSLVRIKQGNFSISNAYTIEEIKNGDCKLLNIKEFLDYPVIEVPYEYIKTIVNGGFIPNTMGIKDKVIFTYKNKDIAIYEAKEKDLRPYIML